MPTLSRAMRRRVRRNKRVWTPFSYNLLSYTIFSVTYTRTYHPVPVDINDQYPTYDHTPYGFYFAPLEQPPLVPLTAEASINTTYANSSTTSVGGIANPTPVPNPLSQENYWQHGERQIKVGTTSTRASQSSFVVNRVTVVADPGNGGTIWVQGIANANAGVGFPLAAGASKDFGDLTSSKKHDLSTFVFIGTNASDKVNLAYEY